MGEDDDETVCIALVHRVRVAVRAEQEAAKAVQESLVGDVDEAEREKRGQALNAARQALADARVALVEHAMAGPA